MISRLQGCISLYTLIFSISMWQWLIHKIFRSSLIRPAIPAMSLVLVVRYSPLESARVRIGAYLNCHHHQVRISTPLSPHLSCRKVYWTPRITSAWSKTQREEKNQQYLPAQLHSSPSTPEMRRCDFRLESHHHHHSIIRWRMFRQGDRLARDYRCKTMLRADKRTAVT